MLGPTTGELLLVSITSLLRPTEVPARRLPAHSSAVFEISSVRGLITATVVVPMALFAATPIELSADSGNVSSSKTYRHW